MEILSVEIQGSFWHREKHKQARYVAFTQAQMTPTLGEERKQTDFQFLWKPQPHGELVSSHWQHSKMCWEQWTFLELVCREVFVSLHIKYLEDRSDQQAFFILYRFCLNRWCCISTNPERAGTHTVKRLQIKPKPTKQKYTQFIFQVQKVGFKLSGWLDLRVPVKMLP